MVIDDKFDDNDRFIEETKFERLSKEYMSIGGIFVPRFDKDYKEKREEPEKTDYLGKFIDYVTSFFYEQ